MTSAHQAFPVTFQPEKTKSGPTKLEAIQDLIIEKTSPSYFDNKTHQQISFFHVNHHKNLAETGPRSWSLTNPLPYPESSKGFLGKGECSKFIVRLKVFQIPTPEVYKNLLWNIEYSLPLSIKQQTLSKLHEGTQLTQCASRKSSMDFLESFGKSTCVLLQDLPRR